MKQSGEVTKNCANKQQLQTEKTTTIDKHVFLCELTGNIPYNAYNLDTNVLTHTIHNTDKSI